MHRAVILEHTTPDGTAHFDWMIEDPAALDDRRLRTWRASLRPDRLGRFPAEQIAHHKLLYLDFEGPIPPASPGGPGRGVVRRLAEGVARWDSVGEDAVALRIEWRAGATLAYAGRRDAPGLWWFTVSGVDPRRDA